MDTKLQRLLTLTDRLLLQVEHGIPPEVEVRDELKQLTGEIRKEHGLPSPVSSSLPGTA